jgi:hypothetical protein
MRALGPHDHVLDEIADHTEDAAVVGELGVAHRG